MPKHRDRLPDDLKEFIALCRKGQLYAVEDWIAAGKRFRNPEGNFALWPLRAAMEKGFHSLVEVLLRAGVEQNEKDAALSHAVRDRRLDLIQLLTAHGADVNSMSFEEVLWCRD